MLRQEPNVFFISLFGKWLGMRWWYLHWGGFWDCWFALSPFILYTKYHYSLFSVGRIPSNEIVIKIQDSLFLLKCFFLGALLKFGWWKWRTTRSHKIDTTCICDNCSLFLKTRLITCCSLVYTRGGESTNNDVGSRKLLNAQKVLPFLTQVNF